MLKLRANIKLNYCFVYWYFIVHQDLRGAFYKFDEGHTGFLTESSFRRMLDSFMCDTTDEEFDKLCKVLGLTSK